MVVREDRKERIIKEAVSIFAENGYYKTTTAMIAKAAGVTQPYVFHFFASKEELFNTVIDRACQRIFEAFSQAEAPPNQLMRTMGGAFIEMMHTHKDEMVMVMQAHAISEPAIREHVRESFRVMHEMILEKFRGAGFPNPEAATSQFFGMGLLITVSEVLQLPELLCLE